MDYSKKPKKPYIPEPILPIEGKLPSDVAEAIPKEEKEAEQLFVISYKYYSHKLCQMRELERSRLRNALATLATVGGLYTVGQFQNEKIGTIGIERKGEYQKLYRGLDNSIEIKEHEIGGSSRLFYWINEEESIFHL